MRRRKFLKNSTAAAALAAVAPWPGPVSALPKRLKAIEKLEGEQPLRAEVRSERGGPRLFVNGSEVYPFLASGTKLVPVIDNYIAAGIDMYNPVLGLQSGWKGPGEYDWSRIDGFLNKLLELNPKARFLPRVQLNTPFWWKEAHPEEMIQYGLQYRERDYDYIRKRGLPLSEGGYYYKAGNELWEASFASEKWREDTAATLRAFVEHIEGSPLRSRFLGYHPATGRTAEWNYFGPGYLPDYSPAMRKKTGAIPSPESRLKTTFGLLRDPAKEADVIRFYEAFHETIAETVLLMADTIKKATDGRVICGMYYGYLLEQVRIQDGGYLGIHNLLESPDIDYLAGPYTYQPGNLHDEAGVPSSMIDGAGNVMGNARGEAGDGGWRTLVESLRRHEKLYMAESDPSTHLDANPHNVFGGHGGKGSDTPSGSLNLLRRDLAQVFVTGMGGWLYDFGPSNQAPKGWYDSPPIISEIKKLIALGTKRPQLDITPVAEIAAIYSARTFTATAHWESERPWEDFGIRYTDYFNHWFINTQVRGLHRIGAPVDYLYHGDLTPEDASRYKMILMINVFKMDAAESERLQAIVRNSSATVVWYYAPGFIAPERLDLEQMQQLTGFTFDMHTEPGSMLIRRTRAAQGLPRLLRYGVDAERWPRFSVTSEDAEVWGKWADLDAAAFATRTYDGYTSVYTGSAPLPIPVLRWLAGKAGVRLWSTHPDIVRGTGDAAMLVATSTGPRRLTLPSPMVSAEGGPTRTAHELSLRRGEVRVFHRA